MKFISRQLENLQKDIGGDEEDEESVSTTKGGQKMKQLKRIVFKEDEWKM
jgi:hypothetical protein